MKSVAGVAALLLCLPVAAQDKLAWKDGYDAALTQAKESKKPVLLLFIQPT